AAASPATPAPITMTDCMETPFLPSDIRRAIMTPVKILLFALLVMLSLAGCSGNSPTMQGGASGSTAGPASNAKAPDETAALDAITKISDAQTNYFRRNRRYAIAFDELIEAHLLNSAPAASGYDFSLR